MYFVHAKVKQEQRSTPFSTGIAQNTLNAENVTVNH